jgi:predicted metal-binding protein
MTLWSLNETSENMVEVYMSDKISFESAKSPVSGGLILICEKCGKKLSDSDDNPARELQKILKETIKETGHKGEAKAVLTSCMDLCPKDAIAVSFARTDSENEFFIVSGKPKNIADEICQKMFF